MNRHLFLKLAAIAILAVIAWNSARFAISSVTERRAPDIALRFNPDNENALVLKASQLILEAPQSEKAIAEARPYAERAIGIAPSNPGAVRVLGLLASAGQENGAIGDADAIMRHALKLSPRSLITNIWMIEDAVRDNDPERALSYYDNALSSTSAAQKVLLPVLIAAIDTESIRPKIVDMVKGKPSWNLAFWIALATADPIPDDIDAFLDDMNWEFDFPPANFYANMVTVLAAQKRFDDAYAIYERVADANKNSRHIELADFAKTMKIPPFDWAYSSSGSFLVTPSKDNQLAVTATRGSSEVVATRMLALKPGRYALFSQTEPLTGVTRLDLTKRLLCGTQAEDGSLVFSPVFDGPVGRTTEFSISSACRFQAVEITKPSITQGKEFGTVITQFYIRTETR